MQTALSLATASEKAARLLINSHTSAAPSFSKYWLPGGRQVPTSPQAGRLCPARPDVLTGVPGWEED